MNDFDPNRHGDECEECFTAGEGTEDSIMSEYYPPSREDSYEGQEESE